MTIFDFLTMLGSLSLFLFGMNFMGQSLERRAGGKLRTLLDKMTGSVGAGFLFTTLSSIFNGMPGGRVIGLVFFLCVLFAGLTSLVNLYEVSVEALQDKLHLKRVAAVAVIAVIGTAVSLCIQAIVSDWMDVVSIYICPLGALLAGILFFWVAGKDFVLAAVNKGAGKPIGAWFYPLSKYVYCACALLALIAGALLGGIGDTVDHVHGTTRQVEQHHADAPVTAQLE